MNEHDPMKDKAAGFGSGIHTGSNGADGRTDADGRGYVNPDGSHGYVYNATSRESGRFNYKSAFITVLAILVSFVLLGCCLVGVYMLVLYDGMSGPIPGETGSPDNETSTGISISDDTADQNGDSIRPSIPGGINDPTNQETAPTLDSITKLPPKREDADGDGHADFAYGEDGQVLTSAAGNIQSVATVVSRVADSVVEIRIHKAGSRGMTGGQFISGGAGSGVIVSSEGYVVTNYHVIDGAETITVRLTDGTEFTAAVVGADEQTDIAVLRIRPGGKTLTVATLGASFDLVVGEAVIAIGNPLGSLGGTVTEGMISATARQIRVNGTVMTLLQTSAPVNEGNSGGGLFNMAGELMGLVNAKIMSDNAEGLGFAVPVDTLYDVILELIHYGYVRGRPALDFKVVEITSYQTAYHYFKTASIGVFVFDQEHKDLKYGDRIMYADGRTVTKAEQLNDIIRGKRIGETLTLIVKRGRDEITVIVTVTEYNPSLHRSED